MVDAIFRMSGKFMDNWHQIFYLDTGEPRGEPFKDIYWFGPEILQLCQDDPNFYICLGHDSEAPFRWFGTKAIEPPE